MSADIEDRERAEFDKWWDDASLTNDVSEIAWQAWQAARREERKRTLEELLEYAERIGFMPVVKWLSRRLDQGQR